MLFLNMTVLLEANYFLNSLIPPGKKADINSQAYIKKSVRVTYRLKHWLKWVNFGLVP